MLVVVVMVVVMVVVVVVVVPVCLSTLLFHPIVPPGCEGARKS